MPKRIKLMADYGAGLNSEERQVLMAWKFGELWRQPDFLKFWAGDTVSAFGTQVSTLALPFTAVLILEATPPSI